MAAGLGGGAAAGLIDRVEHFARTAACDAISSDARELAETGHDVVEVALDLGAIGSGRMTLPDDLAAVLSRHQYRQQAPLPARPGRRLCREALVEAARDAGLTVHSHDFKVLRDTISRMLGPDAIDRVDALAEYRSTHRGPRPQGRDSRGSAGVLNASATRSAGPSPDATTL
ncbi:hypothetical protein [Nonomuraea jiangxiensis]|uniref:hypothetical protein n=1 Tax=Nonomuraea jiangxiensis TaxID=633440 RepID=UPI000B84D770|nr:hypothetical protein [Nonomuraea jiangxiensis]